MSTDPIAWLQKPGRRVLGIDDAPCMKEDGGQVLVVGAVCRGDRLDGLLSTTVTRDGWDATDRLCSMLKDSKFFRQVHAVMLDGITLGGLNIVDIQTLSNCLKLPVLSVMRRRPDRKKMDLACRRVSSPEKRIALLDRAGCIHAAEHVFFQVCGLDPQAARLLVDNAATCGYIPEPVRLAHLIAGGIATGQSGRRA